jgi:hypothetical protein
MNAHTTPLSGLRKRETVSAASHHKGLDATRAAIALAVTGNHETAGRYAERRWGTKSRAAAVTKDFGEIIQKADLPGFHLLQPGGGAELLGADGTTARAEFFDVVVAASVIGRLPFRRVPFHVPFMTQDELTAASWEGEGQAYVNSPVKVTRHDPLSTFKIGATAVATMETLGTNDINCELMIRDALVRSLAHRIDVDFLDPANTGTANEKPASITSGAGNANSPSEPLFEFSDTFTGDPGRSWILLNPYRAARLQSAARPNVGSRGGEWGGFPVATSTAVPEELMVLVDPGFVVVAMGSAELATSTEADIEMETAPANNSAVTVAQASMTSMFQTNSAAVRATITANWKTVNPEAVQYFDLTSFGL